MVTFAQLRNADTTVFRRASTAYGRLSVAAERSADDLTDAAADLGTWRGDAGAAANADLQRLRTTYQAAQGPLHELDVVLASHADAIEQAQRRIAQIVVAYAGKQTLDISLTDGSVRVVVDERTHPEVVADRYRIASGVADSIAAALTDATNADHETARRLNAIVPAPFGTDPLAGGAVPPYSIPRRGADPREVKAWWDSLSPQQKEYLLRGYPQLVGWLDGVPAADRDRANRTVLDEQQQALEARRAVLEARGSGRTPADNAELSDINEKLHGIGDLRNRLDRTVDDTGVGAPRPYLLGFDTQGRGHAVVALGDPDAAGNVVTYVPGTGARLGQVNGDLSRADAMTADANILDPSTRTSTVLWIGYDAPQNIVPEATHASYAQAAAVDLDRFQDGLRVTHDGPRAHQTVVGHSYGSTVVGFTARDYGIDADDLIFVGSPGVGVDTVGGLKGADGQPIDPDHVWSSHARRDPIQYASYHDFWPVGDDGLEPADVLVHGRNPTEPEFGANTFTSDPGEPMKTMKAHSQYWDPYSSSRRNMALIVVGRDSGVS